MFEITFNCSDKKQNKKQKPRAGLENLGGRGEPDSDVLTFSSAFHRETKPHPRGWDGKKTRQVGARLSPRIPTRKCWGQRRLRARRQATKSGVCGGRAYNKSPPQPACFPGLSACSGQGLGWEGAAAGGPRRDRISIAIGNQQPPPLVQPPSPFPFSPPFLRWPPPLVGFFQR